MPLCDSIKRQIWESMDVNEMMMGRMPAGRKNNQLMAAFQQDQMTNIMDHAQRYEETMLTPLAERMFEYERQFRTKSLLIEMRGEIGVKAKMTDVDPQQFDERYQFQWAGTSIVEGQQLQQMRIAGMNVLRHSAAAVERPQAGHHADPRAVGGRALRRRDRAEDSDRRAQPFHRPADVENEMMHNNLPVDVHEADNDAEHLQSHMSAARMTGDVNGRFRAHIAKHTMTMQAKLQKQQAKRRAHPAVLVAPDLACLEHRGPVRNLPDREMWRRIRPDFPAPIRWDRAGDRRTRWNIGKQRNRSVRPGWSWARITRRRRQL
jgi:hypothetical protein